MIQGSCLCGRIAYELRAPLRTMYYCHCRMCRKASGSSFATNLVVNTDDFVIVAGHSFLKSYESSPNEYRHFCGECGSPIYGEAALRPGVVAVRCGTLNEDPGIGCSYHIYTGSKSSWFAISDQLPRFPAAPGE